VSATSDFLDPEPAQFQGDSLLERICRAYEDAVDKAADAYDLEAIAENVYLAERSKAWAYATEDKVAISARSKHVDCQPDVTSAKQEWNWAVAYRDRCRDKARELEHRMMSCMSHQRMVREGTGG
jgi:hypothetical protein